MKRFMIVLCVAAVVGLVAAAAQASVTTITFKGSDIVVDASLTPNIWPTANGVAAVGDGTIEGSTMTKIRTYTRTGTPPAGDPTAFNAWLAGLGTGQGISGFNLWLQDDASNQAAMWGEKIALTNAYSTAITPFASSGWTASVYTVGDEWGSAWKGRQLITYTANSADYYLRPGTTADFGFTADIYGIGGATGPDYQIWVGSGNVVGVDGGYFQRAITANAVPEPTTILVWGLLGLAAAGFGVWRRKRAG